LSKKECFWQIPHWSIFKKIYLERCEQFFKEIMTFRHM
jgi:hypothetical protein